MTETTNVVLNSTQPSEAPFGVYIHWPFCASKCPYCDFNSHVRLGIDQTAYADAICKELGVLRDKSGPRRVTSIFFGGGTPSLMAPQTVDLILNAIGNLWSLDEAAEITLEANPTSVEAENFKGYRAAGVNRLSIGVQSLKDDDLKFLGRQHNVAEALAAVEIATRHFERVSFDLIYARPNQSLSDWQAELHQALQLPIEHLSLYQLTIEPETPFAALYDKGQINLPKENLARDLYDATGEICMEYGLSRYEVSNYARPDAASKHNLIYWRYQDFAGAGPGAHSRISQDGVRLAIETEKHPETWSQQVMDHGHGFKAKHALSQDEVGSEFLIMGMRLGEGIDVNDYANVSGKMLNEAVIAELVQDGFINQIGNSRIAASVQGFAVLDTLIEKLSL